MQRHINHPPGRSHAAPAASGGGQRGFGSQQPPSGGGGPGGHGGGGGDRRRLEDLLRPPRESERERYFSANDPNAPDRDLLGSKAEEVAKKLATMPSSQLRRFYAEVMALKRRAELTDITDAEIRSELMLLRAKAAYTWKRQEKKYPEELVAFFNRHAHSVRTKKEFLRGFQPHFEAVMAFHKVFEIKKDDAA
jgi:CRISPR type III-A-associated protein Csm2